MQFFFNFNLKIVNRNTDRLYIKNARNFYFIFETSNFCVSFFREITFIRGKIIPNQAQLMLQQHSLGEIPFYETIYLCIDLGAKSTLVLGIPCHSCDDKHLTRPWLRSVKRLCRFARKICCHFIAQTSSCEFITQQETTQQRRCRAKESVLYTKPQSSRSYCM